MPIDLAAARIRLAANARAIAALAEGVGDEAARWKPDAASWSVLETLCHLADEEREDFRQRLSLCLADPDAVWPPIDPEGAPAARGYNGRDPAAALADFLAERETSLRWLEGLEGPGRQAPDWDQATVRPWGSLRAGDLMVSWLAHDLLHLRQLVGLHYALNGAAAAPYDPQYAGDW